MEQTRALNALEPFLALSKSANSPRAAADLITQATSAPNTYVFAELLQTPTIQALRDSGGEYAGYLTLLEIFAWGTWEDYKATPNLPSLNAQQHQKLLLLSLLPLSKSHKTLTYPSLIAALSLPSPRALEELITTAIYSNLLTATLDPAHSLINVTSVSPLRDLPPGSLPTLKASLQHWQARCETILGELEQQMADVRAKALAREKEKRRKEAAFEAVMAAEGELKGLGKRQVDEDAMEIDEQSQGGGGGGRVLRGSKRQGALPGFAGVGRRLG